MTAEHETSTESSRPPHRWGVSPFSRRNVLLSAGAVGAAAALAACGNDSSSGTTPGLGGSSGSAGAPKRGGDFRLGLTGGSAKDRIEGQDFLTPPDGARLYSAFETLTVYDDEYKLQMDGLAESVEADGPLQYTIQLRDGIEFHNGKTLTVDDVMYSLQRIGDKSNGLGGYSSTTTMDLANMKKLDKYTLRLPMKTADSTVPDNFALWWFSIVPKGYESYSGDLSTQVGTGAYKFKSFTPGERSVSERNPNYWRGDGSPWFDTVTIIDFSDTTALINGLAGGQIDAMTDVPAGQVDSVKSNGNEVLISPGGFWTPLCMRVDTPPFDDVRVRQALRLIVDRKQMIEQLGSGYGQLGNDLYSPFDAAYLKDAPQREQDIDKAKALLKEAGQEGLTVDLHTTNAAAGMVEIASVYATQAKAAGVTVNVRNEASGVFYGDQYLNWPFSIDYWSQHTYMSQVQSSGLPDSPYNETHWPPKSGEGSDFQKLYNKALATPDEAARIQILQQMQQSEYDAGGYIIPYFPSRFDGYAANVKGLVPSKLTLGLGNFGHGFRTIWFE